MNPIHIHKGHTNGVLIPIALLSSLLSALVVPNFSLLVPECPFEVANTAGSIDSVFTALFSVVVGNVSVSETTPIELPEPESEELELVRKTRAKPGAGTGMAQDKPGPVAFTGVHETVWIIRSPERRPSDCSMPPNVCVAQCCV